MKKVTSLLVMLILMSVPMHLLTAQTTEQNGMAINPDLIMYLMGMGGSDIADMNNPSQMGDGMMQEDGMMGGMMHGGMSCGRGMGSMMGSMNNDEMMCGMMHGPGMMHGIRMYVMFIQFKNALGLTQDQLNRMQSQILDYVRAVAPIEANIKIAKAETVAQLVPLLEIQGPNPDMNAVDQKIHQIQKLRGDLQVATIRLVVNLKGILTQDQLQKLQSLMLNMVSMMHGGGKCPLQQMPGKKWQPQQSQPQPQQQPQQQGNNQSGM